MCISNSVALGSVAMSYGMAYKQAQLISTDIRTVMKNIKTFQDFGKDECTN